jgi:sugar phosphate isomerase/epimerase
MSVGDHGDPPGASEAPDGWGRPARPVALSTSSVYPLSCPDAFALAVRLGFDGVEVLVWRDPVSQDIAALSALADYHEVPVLSVHAPTLLLARRVWDGDPGYKLRRSCEMAAALGAGVVVTHPPFRWERHHAEVFTETIADLEREFSLIIAVENMFPWGVGRHRARAHLPDWDPTGQVWPHVTLDLSHAATAGQDGLDLARRLGDRLVHLHLGDGNGSSRDEHLVPGDGTQPCDGVLRLLAERNWTGRVVVEVNTRRMDTARREGALARSLAFARWHLSEPSAPPWETP